MQSFAWMNGQYQHVGPHSQSQQGVTLLTSPTMWIQQAGTANNSSSTCARPPQSAHSTFRDGAYSDRQISHQQNSGVPNRAVSSQLKNLLQQAGETQSQQSATQLTSPTMWIQQAGRTSHSSRTCVRPPQSTHSTFRDGAYPDRQTSHWQNSGVPHQTVSSQLAAGGETNNYYVEVTQGKLQDSFTNAQSGNPLVTNGQQVATQQVLHPNTGFVSSVTQIPPKMMKSNTTYPQQDMSARWNQQANEQMVYTSTSVSTSAPKRQVAPKQNYRQHLTHNGFSSSNPPPNYNQAVSHSVRNYRTAEQASCMRQITQQYQTNVNSRHNAMTHETQRFVSKTNDVPKNPSAATQDQIIRSQTIARIEDDLRRSCTQMSNPNMQPVTQTISNRYNSNASTSLPLNSGLPLSNTVISRMQQSVNAPQQSSVPNVYSPNNYVTATSGGYGEVRPTDGNGGKAANANFPERKTVPNGSLFGALHKTSQLMNLPESLTRKRKRAESSQPIDILELLVSSVTANDASIHSSPGRTCTRAVAVVQPLSQESCQVANKHTYSNTMNQSAEHTTSDECLSNPEKLFTSPTVGKNKKDLYIREGSFLYSQDPNKVSSSDSVGHQGSQKQLCADDTGSEPATGMQEDQCVAMTTQQSAASEVTVRQSGDEDKSESPTHDNVILLSSVPTKPWTLDALHKLIDDKDKTQMEHSTNSTVFNSVTKLLDLFWDGTSRNLASRLRSGWYKSLIADVTGYISKHRTTDSVILSELEHGYKKTLTGYHVLKDDEVYLAPPYKSSWLNVNEQLDDIDKEFGFPWSLKHHLYRPESPSQPDQVETVKSIPAEIASEVPDKISSRTELELVHSVEEKRASTPVAASTQADSPDKTKCDTSSDPYYSFEIQVLSPGEAKVIYEQAQSNVPQNMMTDSQPESVMDSSVDGEQLEAIHVTLNASEPEIKSSCLVEEVCCLARWLENITGSKPLVSECQCINEKNPKDCAEKTHNKGEMEVQKVDDICAIWSDSNMEGENQAEGLENIKCEMITYSRSEPCKELSQNLAFAENDDKSLSYSDNIPKNISHLSINSSPLSIIDLSENEDGDRSGSDTCIQSDPGVDCIPENAQSCIAVSNEKDIDNPPGSESGISSWVSDLEEDCGQAQLTSTDVGESALETEEEQTQISVAAEMQTTFSLSGPLENVKRKHKQQISHDGPFPCLKKSNKFKPPGDVDLETSTCKEVSIGETDSEPSASKGRAVQLVLFGSAPKDKNVLIGGRKRYNSSPAVVPDGVPRPPRMISVKLSPLKRKLSDTVPTGEQSVKWRIHEKWRRSLPPTKMKCQSKLKTWKCTFSSSSGFGIKKTEAVGPTNTERPPISSDKRISSSNGGTRRYMSLKKRRRSLPARLEHGKEIMRKYVVTLKQPADPERSNTEHGSKAGRPLQEKNILRFSVLPNTFDFKDGSNDRKETDVSVPNKPALDEDKDKSPVKTVVRPGGTWYPNPEKKYHPLHSPSVPKTSSLFQEFQKKYKKKTQPSTEELSFRGNREITDCPTSGK